MGPGPYGEVQMIRIPRSAIRKSVCQDNDPDPSYLEQEGLGFEDRLAAYRRGDFGYVGVRAVVELLIPCNGGCVAQTIRSPGLWGIEDDSDAAYLDEVFQEERATLEAMLRELGVEVTE